MSSELERGREAYARRAWSEAYDSLSLADQSTPLAMADLERFAWSAALTSRDEEFLKLLERLYHSEIEAGEGARAARFAFWLAFRLFSLGEAGRASAWLGRSQRLVEREEKPCVEQGYLLLPLAHRDFAIGEFEAAYQTAARALEIGERFGDKDLIAFAHNLQGRALIRQERIEQGLVLLDEAMLEATTNELSPVITGVIYCSAIAGCQQVYALERAREWTYALAKWCEAQPGMVTFTGSCLVHRAEILQLEGQWRGALEEARRASQARTQSDRMATAGAYYQEAEIHRLRGEFDEAEAAYCSASQLGREPQPGLALLRVAQGRADVAANAMRRVIGAATNRLERTRFLPAYVEILLAAGEIDEARRACSELEEISAGLNMEVLSAIAAHARGAVQLAEGDAQSALAPLRSSACVWQQLGAPYLTARVRLLVGLACRALGDEDGTTLELNAARAVFESLGAAPDLARIDALTATRAPNPEHCLTARELEVLRLIAAGKTNKVIAKELHLSQKTVDRHVSNILTKVNAPTRAAATAYAYEHRLI